MNRRDPTLPSVRLPERQRLAEAIEWHAEATTQLVRVQTAQERADNAFFDVLRPAAEAARDALEDARAAQPGAIVDEWLGDGPSGSVSVTAAEAALADAERKLTDARKARSMLADEMQRSQTAINSARVSLDNAVAAAVEADAAVAAVQAEFFAAGRRMLRCAQILKTAGLNMRGLEWAGMHARIGEAAAAIGQRAFWPDLEWTAAIAALRENADAALPGLPEPDDAGDSNRDRAAA